MLKEKIYMREFFHDNVTVLYFDGGGGGSHGINLHRTSHTHECKLKMMKIKWNL